MDHYVIMMEVVLLFNHESLIVTRDYPHQYFQGLTDESSVLLK